MSLGIKGLGQRGQLEICAYATWSVIFQASLGVPCVRVSNKEVDLAPVGFR